MTDARLRGEWLAAVKFDDLSDTAWRVFTRALMFCAENGTDGVILDKHRRYLHPEGLKPDAFQELTKAGLWSRTSSGYQLNDWEGALGQSSAEQVEAYRHHARERQRKARERARQRAEGDTGTPKKSRAPRSEVVTGDVTRDVTRDVGIGKGTGIGKDSGTPENLATSWEVAKIPGGEGWPHEGWVETSPGVFEEVPA